MGIENVFQALSISASGLMAERARMGLIATNIAHAQDADRGDGTPYRRKMPVFETVLDGALQGGVRVAGVVEDEATPLNRVRQPGHPLADADGFVTLPNVNPAFEMVDLLTASRAYEANLETLQVMVRMAEQALELGR